MHKKHLIRLGITLAIIVVIIVLLHVIGNNVGGMMQNHFS